MKEKFASRLKNKSEKKRQLSNKLTKCYGNLNHATETLKNVNTAFDDKLEKAEKENKHLKKIHQEK